MLGLVFLCLGALCAIIGRILLARAAFGISIWWGVGVFVPFGPLLFRLNFPDASDSSRAFRLAAVPCLFLYFLLGPGVDRTAYFRHKTKPVEPPRSFPPQYALEVSSKSAKGAPSSKGPKVETTPSVEDRRAANAQEFERLNKWKEALRLRKRDLLRSNVAGNEAYMVELAQYNAAFAKANAERSVLWPAAK
jgi:hypothetical protein